MAQLPLFDVSPRHRALTDARAPEEIVAVASRLVFSVSSHPDPSRALYIGRTFGGYRDLGWGNPLKLAQDTPAARLELLRDFYQLLCSARPVAVRWRAAIAAGELTERELLCWCAPAKLCHGHVLAAYAAGLHAPLAAWLAA